MCLQHDVDHIRTRGWCRGAQTGKFKPIPARKKSFNGREGKYSPYPSNILARFNNLPRAVWNIAFLSLSACGNQKMLSPKKQGSSWKQLALTNVSQSSTSCWLCWRSFKSCSVFGPSAFFVDPALSVQQYIGPISYCMCIFSTRCI